MEDSSVVGEFLSKNKKVLIIFVIMIVISIILGIAKKSVINKQTENNDVKPTPETAAELMAGLYYEDILYPSFKEETYFNDLMDYYYENGIEVDLKTLNQSITDVNYEIFVNSELVCDYNYSYVKIYPTEGYEKKDYRVESYMQCTEPIKKEED